MTFGDDIALIVIVLLICSPLLIALGVVLYTAGVFVVYPFHALAERARRKEETRLELAGARAKAGRISRERDEPTSRTYTGEIGSVHHYVWAVRNLERPEHQGPGLRVRVARHRDLEDA